MSNECPDTTGEWGKPCPTCGQVLPENKGPLTGWRSGRRVRCLAVVGGGFCQRIANHSGECDERAARSH